MRLDKYLKVCRVIKRRTVANEMCSAGRVSLNGRPAKPGAEVKPGDILEIGFGSGRTRLKILAVRESVRKEEADSLYEILQD
ncbi:MAG: RNA-binding S4 domain-containing protein [Ruminococcaceae bacterium]|jgi:ribosomal 50S subunit-recycling heat shock protein|nr:RNA-binding S4 domain-containing protein [Oscillospiraceae bacterium]